MDPINIILILITGIAAGFINTLAGGGSLLTLPMLIFLGLGSAVANGTNRIAIMVQNIVAILNFRKNGYFDWRLGLLLGIPALVGAIIGSSIAVSLPDQIFNKILAIVMIIILVFTLWQPHKKIKVDKEILSTKRRIIAAITFFFVGIYGGFIQAGVGFIIIASLVLITGMSLVKINSLKVFVVLVYMFSSIGIFIYHGEVNWGLGFTLAIGNGVGGFLGSKFAVTKGDKWIRVFLVIAVIAMAIKLLLK